MKIKGLTAILLAAVFISCNSKQKDQNSNRDFIINEKDLVPEGVAFDRETQTIYISSTHKRKIVSIDKEGKVSDFIKEGQDGIASVIGMEVDNRSNSIWVVSAEANDVLPLKDPGPHQWTSSVYQFNLSDGSLIKKYRFDRDSVFLNDLTVGPDGTVYVTESIKADLFQITPGSDSLSLLLSLPNMGFANGICFADKADRLYVATMSGIVAIDLPTKQISLLNSPSNVNHKNIDGLAFRNNYFIGHQSRAVCRFYFSNGEITHSDTLNTGKEFDSSTTGELGDDHYYFIVNSQVQSAIDYARKQLKPMDSLESVIIRKIKL